MGEYRERRKTKLTEILCVDFGTLNKKKPRNDVVAVETLLNECGGVFTNLSVVEWSIGIISGTAHHCWTAHLTYAWEREHRNLCSNIFHPEKITKAECIMEPGDFSLIHPVCSNEAHNSLSERNNCLFCTTNCWSFGVLRIALVS